VRDRHALGRSVTVVPAVDWRLVSMIFAELRYVDAANKVDEESTLSFFDIDQERGPKTFAVNLVDGQERAVRWNATFVLKDNRTVVVPPSITTGSAIVLRTDMAGHRIITVLPPPVDFAAAGITSLEARLRYQDVASGLSFEDVLTFAGSSDKRSFEFDYVDPARSSYSATMRVFFANGLSQDRALGSFDVDRLVLPAI